MSNTKLSPRQKMINMMYLVLTALLAMNVSQEVLNAFKIVGQGIKSSNSLSQSRNNDYYSSFQEWKAKNPSEEAIIFNALFNRTKQNTDEALAYIEAIQEEIKQKSGVIIKNNEEVFKHADDLNTATKLLSTEQNGKVKGEELRLYLGSLRQQYLDIIEQGNQSLIGSENYQDFKTVYASILPLKEQEESILGLGNEKKTWAEFNFGNVPVIASDVILEKLKNDIIHTESQVLDFLLEQANGGKIDFDILEAKLIAPKSYLASGKEYEADIFISAASSSNRFEVFIGEIDKTFFAGQNKKFTESEDLPFKGDYSELAVEGGKAKFKELAQGVGSKNYEGILRLKKPNGGYELYPFYGDYEVAPPSGMSISPTMMNVLYIGVDNPISIAVNGAKSDADVRASISQGTLTKNGNGQYIAKVNTPGIASINVSANVNDKNESFAPMEFRVMNIPDPKISLCGFVLKNKMQKSEILACNGLIAQTQDFVFESKFEVVSFDVIIRNAVQTVKQTNSGPIYNQEVMNMLNNLAKKDVLVFDNILVKDPAKKNRKISGSIFIEVI
ncbi:MAG: GldM family protein [Chitinophagales bacterium]